MADRSGSKSRDYVVGYGRPPKATQFKPGESGNPKGRPKGSRTVGAILENILKRRIAVTENGKTRRIATLEVALRRLVNDALRGDHGGLKFLLTLLDRDAGSPETLLQLGEILAEDQEILTHYLQAPDSLAPGLQPSSNLKGDGDGI